MITKPTGALSRMPTVNKQPLSVQQRQAPRSMGQGDNYHPAIHNQQVRQQMQMRGNVNPMPPALQNPGRYAGFESNYFPQARMNMPMNMNQGINPMMGAQPNMGMAQGNPGNYFPQAQMNNPFIRR